MSVRRSVAALALAAALSHCATAAPPDPAARLAGRAMGETPLVADVKELCDRVGGRPTGSAANARAVEWIAARFRAAGADTVTLEAAEVPYLWLPGSAEAEAVSPESFPLRVAACPEAPSTPGVLTARLVDAGEGTPADYAKLGGKTQGAIALVRAKEMKSADDLFGEYVRNGPLLSAAKAAGVSAILLQSTRPKGLLYRHPMSLGREMAPLPVAMVAREQAARLQRLAGTSDVIVRLSIVNRTGPAYEAKNVVADIRGSEKPEEIVLLGAHLDSWDLGTGANDNGINVALLVDVLRGIRELGLAPKRTIRLVAFNAEEQGLWGSAGYVKRHAAELGRHAVAVIFDVGSGRTTGFYLNGREELRAPLDRALAPVAGLDASRHSKDGVDGTDNFDFLLSGVPNLVADQDWEPYLPDYHAESDTFDAVDAREARANAAIAAAVVWGFANADGFPAPRQTRAEVEKLLVDAKLVDQMKAFGQWEEWKAGTRGVSK